MCGLEWIYLSEYFVKYSNTVSAFAVVQLLSLICLLVTPWTTARQSPLSSTISQSLLNSCVELAMLSNHLILCHPLLLLPSAFPSIIVYSNLLALFIKWPKVVLELQLQQQSVQWIFRVNFLSDWLVWSPCSPEDSQESSPAPQLESIFHAQPSLWFSSHIVHDYWKNHGFDYTDLCRQSDISAF